MYARTKNNVPTTFRITPHTGEQPAFVAFDYNIRYVSTFETNGKTETSNNRYKFLETQVKGASIWDALQIGAAGAILGIANALPHACVTIWEAFRMREREPASDWQSESHLQPA